MSEPEDKPTFSSDYVKELRQENASWRTKLRETEERLAGIESQLRNTQTTTTVANELLKRGIKADPSWIKPKEGQSINDAVDIFLNDYPQFNITTTTTPQPTPSKPNIPPVSKNEQGSNTPPPGERTLKELKEDPKARAEIREMYRQMLSAKTLTS
jgi:hypothetical protein